MSEEQPQQLEMFPQIGEDEPAEEFLPGYATREEAAAALEEHKRLKEEFERQRQSWQEQEARMNSMMERMLALQGQAAAPQPQQPPAVDWDTLPDPVEDPAAFKTQLAQRIDQMVSMRTAAMSHQTSQQQAAAELERQFYEKNKDLAKFPEIVRSTTQAELQKLAASGLNPVQYVFSDPDGFMKRVADSARARVNELRGEFAPEPPANNRTFGVSGGSGGQAPMSNGQAAASSFVDELKAVQRATGLF